MISRLIPFIVLSVLIDGRQYTVHKDIIRTGDEAKAFCENRGTTLATIITMEDNKNLKKEMDANEISHLSVWVGLRDQEQEGNFKWDDGTKCPKQATSPDYCIGHYDSNGNGLGWADGEPNNLNDEDCSVWHPDLDGRGWANDLPCNDRGEDIVNADHVKRYTACNRIAPATTKSPNTTPEKTVIKLPTLTKTDYCLPAYGRGVGTIPQYCPHSHPELDGLLCYPLCNAGYNGVGPVCWERCKSHETDDGAFCRVPLVTVVKDTYGRGAGVIPTGCGWKENDFGLCYPRCARGYYGVGPLCWQRCPWGYDDHGLTCFKWDWFNSDIIWKRAYGRGVGTIPNVCPGHKPDMNAGLCYPYCRSGYYGVGPVCWKHCNGVDRGALCEIQSLEIRAKHSYGRGAGRIRNGCGNGKENDAGLCYPKCKNDAVWDGVGPVCWNRNFGTALGVILGTAWLNVMAITRCAGIITPYIATNMALFLDGNFDFSGYNFLPFQVCLWPTVKAAGVIDDKWSSNSLTVAFELALSANNHIGVGAFGGIAFNFPTHLGEDLEIYVYYGTSTFLTVEPSAGGAINMVIYRKKDVIPGDVSYFSVGADIPETPIGVSGSWAFNDLCEVVGMGFGVGIGTDTVIPVSIEIGAVWASELTYVYSHHADRRRLQEAVDEYQLSSRRKLLLPSPADNGKDINKCFKPIKSQYYARCHSIRTIHKMNTLDLQKICAKRSECIGYTLDTNTDTAEILSLQECARNGIHFFDNGQNDGAEEFYVNECIDEQQKAFCDRDGFCELKRAISAYPIETGRPINEYYTKCPFDVKVVMNIQLPSNSDDNEELIDEWYNVFTFDSNGDIPYPGLFVNYLNKNYKLQIGENNECISNHNTLSIGNDDIIEISIKCNGKSTLSLNNNILCETDEYNMFDIQSCDGTTCQIFASDATYKQSFGKLISVKATKPKYIWNGHIKYKDDNSNGVIFSSITNIEYIFHSNLLAAPYLKFDTPYSIEMDIYLDYNEMEDKLKYNVFQIGFQEDLCTDVNDIYLDFDKENGLILGISTLNETILRCNYQNVSSSHWNNVKISITENRCILIVNDNEACFIETEVNVHQQMVPLILSASTRYYAVKGKFKNIEIINNGKIEYDAGIDDKNVISYLDIPHYNLSIKQPNIPIPTWLFFVVIGVIAIFIINTTFMFYTKCTENRKSYDIVKYEDSEVYTDNDSENV